MLGAQCYDEIYSTGKFANFNTIGMYILGIDEAGRGALAGPVVVGVVAIPKGFSPKSAALPPLRDSKKLSARQRNIWFNYIKTHPDIFYASARVYQVSIDKNNIATSANVAASRALNSILGHHVFTVNSILLDGSLYLDSPAHSALHARTIVRGDQKFICIKLASIVAKVTRDGYMVRLHKKYPVYEFGRHKGYGTEIHRNMIQEYGPSDPHRLTYLKN